MSAAPNDPLYYVTVTKVADKGMVQDPAAPDGKHPIYEGYTIKGICTRLPEIKVPFIVIRHERNGIKVPGVFTTSPVVATAHFAARGVVRFSTANSEYRVEYTLDNPEAKGVE